MAFIGEQASFESMIFHKFTSQVLSTQLRIFLLVRIIEILLARIIAKR